MGMLTCAGIEHDADRHVILAEPYGNAKARYAQRAVQLMRPAQQLIAVLLIRHKGSVSYQQSCVSSCPSPGGMLRPTTPSGQSSWCVRHSNWQLSS